MTVNFAHCFFEQSGVFRDEFNKLGIPAKDYDIDNQFGKTDIVKISTRTMHNYTAQAFQKRNSILHTNYA